MENLPFQNEWTPLLKAELESPQMQALFGFLEKRRASGVEVYPPSDQVFAAFAQTPPQNVRVVILGQDPYHNVGQAHGLCFSVNSGTPVPPSLANIFRELRDDLGIGMPSHGNLGAWANQGVLLLNTVLTVEKNHAGSHQGKGWEQFTDRVIRLLSDGDRPLVFMLWGAQAQKKGQSIDRSKHCVLTSSHPSPLSAYRGFLGCRHFSKANDFLKSQGVAPIDWSLPELPKP
ncbi:uracil-DNA glycosylase [Congregibacter variabilis]|uniref:Uracil-DNA glycosylase n=1 Tax=Congregibacter variabilis TaxID=3081200 RepID=A0ABZ0I4F8_9GAMM|nr:uracil-DNA glycosylase [Congregibacter sp. IMCC43200]